MTINDEDKIINFLLQYTEIIKSEDKTTSDEIYNNLNFKIQHENVPTLQKSLENLFSKEEINSYKTTLNILQQLLEKKRYKQDFFEKLQSKLSQHFFATFFSNAEKATAEQTLHTVIAKAVTDTKFRKKLFKNPEYTLSEYKIRLNKTELAALKSLKQEELENFSQELDERITKMGFDYS